ncbi:hypothetical protein AMECASPLE_031350, partial [Ameca splendens]
WCWSSQVCWVTGATYSTDCQEYLSWRLPALQCFESLSFGSMSQSFLDYVSESYSGGSSLSSFLACDLPSFGFASSWQLPVLFIS